jgi:uncharacterized protein (DUF983 family)
MHDQPSPAAPAQAQTHKRCPACGASKLLSEFYTTPSSAPSSYCKRCQRAASRRSRRRRNAALRALIALHPEEWRAALQHDPDHGEPTVGGGADVA